MLLRRFLRSLLWGFLRVNSRWLLVLGHLLYQLEVVGQDNLPAKGPFLLVGRHSSRLEIFGLAYFCCVLREFYGLAAGPALVNRRSFGVLSRALGALPAFKEKGLAAAPLLEACKLLSKGEILVLGADELPWDGRPQPLRPGAAWLALRTHAPVIVFLLKGSYDIWPRWASLPHLTGKLVLKIGAPFYLCDAPCTRVTEPMLQDANRRIRAELERLADGYMLRSRATTEVEA
jgi:1-acyl-sn-glycerol-3-phosphate acyltransferase